MQNIHPMIVHFPIALLFLAGIFELVYLFLRKPEFDLVGRWLLYLGTIGAGLAALSGWLGEQTVAPVAAAHDVIEKHQRFAYFTLGISALLSFWRAATQPRGGPRPRPLFAAGLVVLLTLLWYTGHEGGELVFEYGVGTEMTEPEGPLGEDPEAASDHSDPDVPTSKDFK
jgi:uncharacterized membrane protein